MVGTKAIAVIGSGQMGSGIAQLAAIHGLDVYLLDTDSDALSHASKSIFALIHRLVSKCHLSQEIGTDALCRLRFTRNLKELSSSDFVIEAIVESENVKKKLFYELDKIVKKSAILASNTSSISITQLGSATSRPDQLVEIVRGADTSDYTFSATKALAERFGKTVICSQDYAGFIVNQILMPMINEAFYTLYTVVATKEDIDAGMKLGTNHPMGPLELADFICLLVLHESSSCWFGQISKAFFCPLKIYTNTYDT